jgi:hypothetical protein
MAMPFLALAAAFLLSACGGNGGGNPDTAVTPPLPTASTGTIVILLTDAPVDELSAINLDVTEVSLIGDMGQQVVFTGTTTINLLDLAHFDQPIAFGEVEAGNFNKIRLRIESVELVDKNTGMSTFPKLPANGKIDLLDRNGFAVFPGRTLLVEIDIDARKSIHIVGTGNGNYRFRPVVKVNIMDGGLPAKLVRLEGIVTEIFDDPAGRFLLCHAEDSDSCIIVVLAKGGSVFDAEGLPGSIGKLMIDDSVVAIGAFRQEDDGDSGSDASPAGIDLELDAIVIEIGGNAGQFKGVVASAPDENGKFQLVVGKETVTVLVQDATKIFGIDGVLGPDAIVVDGTIVVEGVVVKSTDPDQSDGINAALIFIGDVVDDQMLRGKIVEPLDADTRSFILATDGGDLCVQLLEEAKVILVSSSDDGSVSEEGDFSDLAPGQSVEVFGHSGVGGCFQANEVVVAVTS